MLPLPHDRNAFEAPPLAELTHEPADHAVRPVLDVPIPLFHFPEIPEQAIRGDGVDAHGADLLRAHPAHGAIFFIAVGPNDARDGILGALEVRAPGAQACGAGDDPGAPLDVFAAGAGGEDFEAGFVAGHGGGGGRADGGGEGGGGGGVGPLDLVDVGGVQRGG